MLKATNKSGPGGRRLVLGFDGGCLTCLELAKRIDERLGDKLEVQNLRDPDVERWRRETLGEDAPWAPTLFEVRGERVRAWTGWRVGVVLIRFLGPSETWRVMQVLGEMRAPRKLVSKPSEEEATGLGAAVGMSRARFLKGLGGAAVAMSVLSGTGRLAPLAAAVETQDFEAQGSTALKGRELERIARRVAGRKDVVKIMGKDWSRSVQNGSRVISQCQNGDCVVVIGTGNGSCKVRRVNDRITLSGNCVEARARRHKLKDGNELLSVSYAMNQSERTAYYYEYEKPIRNGRHSSEAGVYQQDGRYMRLRRRSDNGRLTDLSRSRSVTTSSHCGGCSERDFTQDTSLCADWNWYCLAGSCGGCFVSSPGWRVLSCVYVLCPLAYFGCCTDWQPACAGCYDPDKGYP